jgi:hypothetical protein
MNKRKLSPVDKVMKLVDDLTSEEKVELQRRLRLKDWSKRWVDLKDKIEGERLATGLPPMNEEEVYAEFTAHRRERRARSAEGNN